MAVPRPELGKKRVCVNCQTKFYDLDREPIVCPSCGFEHAAEMFARPKTPSRPARPAPTPARAAPAEAEAPELEVDNDVEESEDEDLIEDTDELGSDDVPDVLGDDDDDDSR